MFTELRRAVRNASRAWRWEALLVALSLVASAPLLVYGFPHPTHDGFWHLRWWTHFSAQFWSGELYPRWLVDINLGCGSPTFFYYPPLPYWISAAFAPIAGFDLPAWRALGWGAALSVVLSGLTAFWCLRNLASPMRACVGAALYMLMPYHLAIDILERGAYAESWAFVWMPMVIVAILEQRERKPNAWLKATTGFGLLFMTHLPTTVTFTPLALGLALAYGLRVLGFTLAALATGVGLAAVYLLPALTTQHSVSTQYLRFPYETAFFFPTLEIFKPLSRPDAFNFRVLWSFGLLGLACFSFYSVLIAPNQPRAFLKRTLPWLGLSYCAALMMLPVSDPLYRLFPPLQMIQFPWRFLAPGSLFLAVLAVLFWPESGALRFVRLLHGMVLLVVSTSIVILTLSAFSRTSFAPKVRYGVPPAIVDPMEHDVPEYRPAQANLDAARSQMGSAKIKVVQGDAKVTSLDWRPRLIRLETEAATNAQILVRQFYYPGWSAATSNGVRVAVAADPATGLVSLRLPAGSQEITIRLLPGAAEQVGWWVSSAAVMVCLGVFLRGRRNRQRQSPTPEPASAEPEPVLAAAAPPMRVEKQNAQ